MSSLNILHINKLHRPMGGAETSYFETAGILEKHGCKAFYFAMQSPGAVRCSTEEFFVPQLNSQRDTGLLQRLKLAGRCLYSKTSVRNLTLLLKSNRIDIAHIHDIDRQMSPSVLHALKKANIPVVMTLHNYKLVCPSFRMLRNYNLCQKCSQGKYLSALREKCIKNSYLRSGLAAAENFLHNTVLDIYDNVDLFIAPSLFLKNKFLEMGFQKKIEHLPYIIDVERFSEETVPAQDIGRKTITYFGRLVREKGVYVLLDAAERLLKRYTSDELVITIIGEGPLEKKLKAEVLKRGLDNVIFIGFMTGEPLYREIRKSIATVLPSQWYENYPVAIEESFALARPVIASRIGGIPELVKDKVTGLLFEPGDAAGLAAQIELLVENPAMSISQGQAAREFALKNLDQALNFHRLRGLYDEAIRINGKAGKKKFYGSSKKKSTNEI
ncbi:MAG: glycosyltransferase [Nitrospira sp.]|nr:glycosyltransferase [bacterium]MBL7049271.1 glycosyltransferase [Nitrospira sp.]